MGDPHAQPWSESELLKRADSEPGSFSSSALLRTVAQDSLLPVAASVLGPGELSYWAQVAPLHHSLHVPMPALVLRDRVQVLEPRDRKRLQQLELSPDDLRQAPTVLVDRLMARDGHGVQALHGELAQGWGRTLEAALRTFDPAGADLAGPTQALQAQIDRALQRYVDKVARMRARAGSDAARAVQHLRYALMPEGVPQERFYGWACYASRHGADSVDGGLAKLFFGSLDPAGTLRTLCP